MGLNSDTGSFGSLQALPSFLRRFGVETAPGTFALPASRQSMMNSLPWIGKIIGCLGGEGVIERLGFKRSMYLVSVIQVVGVTSKSCFRLSYLELYLSP